jgi:hypothetical protein
MITAMNRRTSEMILLGFILKGLQQKYDKGSFPPPTGTFRRKSTTKDSEAPRPHGGASRRGSFVHIVPLDPAFKAGIAGHVPVKKRHHFHPCELLFATESL